ncbi:phage holin [Terribacillus saccharophilus]|uniref:Phage holin n=1 Tax=Terribacillus saccharophilus TaxID=361277 RepID=A0ABX4H077_9BACI|nr:phage holin [Terribacillus saccharophilus]PAD35989.1 phage holin [Terribacillus saccharophilus]PAD96961.1 phage holin [Terribacillus saccharophilus]PAE00537.1 phage holin [Terribacillus saccharophilus]
MINWKVRFKNPQFIIQLALSIIVPILAYAGLTAQDLTSWPILFEVVGGAFSNPYVLFLVAVSVYNSVVDNTTRGVSDSAQVMSYDKPKGSGL